MASSERAKRKKTKYQGGAPAGYKPPQDKKSISEPQKTSMKIFSKKETPNLEDFKSK
jgi:hypothetical protein